MGSLAKGFLQKVYGNSAGTSRKFGKIICSIASGKCAEILRKVCGNFVENFCNDPFPNDPISELLKQGFSESLLARSLSLGFNGHSYRQAIDRGTFQNFSLAASRILTLLKANVWSLW